MPSKTILAPILGILLMLACSSPRQSGMHATPYGPPNVNAGEIEQDFRTWWAYFNQQIILSENFVALDAASAPVSKRAFLQSLKKGGYIPLKLQSQHDTTYLKLHPLSPSADEDIMSTMQNQAALALEKFEMEGTEFPDFQVKSLDGRAFNNENTQGKVMVLKCWFLACHACIAEFPELNQLVESYQGRTDIEFVSLAYDKEEAIRSFMQKKEFKYAVAHVERDFLENELRVREYPTHFIVDQKGVIRKVVNKVQELEAALHMVM